MTTEDIELHTRLREAEAELLDVRARLKQSESLLDLVTGTITDGLVVIDPDLRFGLVNERYVELLGVPPELVQTGAYVRDLTLYLAKHGAWGDGDPEDLANRRLDDLLNEQFGVIEAAAPSGRIVEIRKAPRAGGGAVALVADITERKNAEDQLRQTEAQLRVILDYMPSGVLYVDKDLKNVLFNPLYWQLHGYDENVLLVGADIRDELRFQANRGDFGPGDPDELVKQIASAYEKDEPTRSERLIASTGQILQLVSAPTGDGGFVTIATDITERKRAIEALATKEAQLRLAMENMPGAMFVVDENLDLVLVNDRYKEFYGHPDGLLAEGNSMTDVLRFEMEQGILVGDGTPEEIMEQRIASFRAQEPSEFEDVTPDGQTMHILRKPAPGNHMVSVVTDITELKKAEEKLRSTNDELQELNELKNRFMGMAAHDLRNPLGAIRSMSEMIMIMDLGAETEKEFVTSINNVSNQMLDLINDLLDVAAIESGNFDLKWEAGDLAELLRSRINLVQFHASAKDISISTDIPEIPTIAFDHARIGQVLDNLLSNAVKFSEAGSVIDVAMRVRSKFIEVAIKDHGQGIVEDEIDQLFMPFELLSATPTAGEKSTGLGLSIVKKIVDSHNGNIRVDSVLGKGAEFTLSLPRTHDR